MDRSAAARYVNFLRAVEPVVQAFANGKDVQYKFSDSPDEAKYWYDSPTPDFAYLDAVNNPRTLQWRIKPVPMTVDVWVCITPHKQKATYNDDVTSYDRDFTIWERSLNPPPTQYAKYWKKVHMQEVEG